MGIIPWKSGKSATSKPPACSFELFRSAVGGKNPIFFSFYLFSLTLRTRKRCLCDVTMAVSCGRLLLSGGLAICFRSSSTKPEIRPDAISHFFSERLFLREKEEPPRRVPGPVPQRSVSPHLEMGRGDKGTLLSGLFTRKYRYLGRRGRGALIHCQSGPHWNCITQQSTLTPK